MTLQILSFLSFALAVFCYAIKELQSHGKLRWMNDEVVEDLTEFWGEASDIRKYKTFKVHGAKVAEIAPNGWYYRFFKIKYKERFPLSATLLVFLTDGYHMCQFLFKLLFCISIVTYSAGFNWWMALGYFLIWGVCFSITYKWFSK